MRLIHGNEALKWMLSIRIKAQIARIERGRYGIARLHKVCKLHIGSGVTR